MKNRFIFDYKCNRQKALADNLTRYVQKRMREYSNDNNGENDFYQRWEKRRRGGGRERERERERRRNDQNDGDRFPISSLSRTRLILVYDTAAGRCLGEYPPDSLSTQLYNPLSNWLVPGPP